MIKRNLDYYLSSSHARRNNYCLYDGILQTLVEKSSKNQQRNHLSAMPPLVIDDSNINPIVFDLLNEMWKFEDYDASEHDNTLFIKTLQKDYSVPNHHGIYDWLESEYAEQFDESNDGFSSHFEYKDNVYDVAMMAVD